MAGVHAVAADSAHAFGRHMHDQYGLGLMLRGAQKSLSGRGVVEAEEGDLITVNPGEVHDGAPIGDGGRAWRMLYFEPEALAGTLGQLTEGAARDVELAHPAMRDAASARQFAGLFRALTDPLGGHSELEAGESLLLLLAALIDRPPPDGPSAHAAEHPSAGPRQTSRGIAQARGRIDDDPAAPLSLAELAAIGGISPFQLVRGFSRATGLTPHAYLVQRRLQRARRLIAAGTGLAEAALCSGFSDQSHLTRLFVRAYGIPPGRYAAALT
jgi:AraC-like DNA-binding protein